jgi:hypothetical protein
MKAENFRNFFKEGDRVYDLWEKDLPGEVVEIGYNRCKVRFDGTSPFGEGVNPLTYDHTHAIQFLRKIETPLEIFKAKMKSLIS